MSAPIGPQIPSTPSERMVWRDWLLERGIQPPWPIEEKSTSIRGSILVARISAAMAKMAEANALLAGLDDQRIAAEAEVKAAEESIERMGISSISQLSGINGQREYAVCADPNCEQVEVYSWRAEPNTGWRCDKHQLPKVPEVSSVTERAAAALDEEQPF